MNRAFDFVESELAPGLSVIEASAGTGKTYSISHLVPRLLLEGTVSKLGEILLVTFTNDAARELSDRVRRVLETFRAPAREDEERSGRGVHRLRRKFPDRIDAVIGRALLDLDRLRASTIHSFCQRTLQEEGALCGFPVMPELIPDDSEFVEAALRDHWQTHVVSDAKVAAIASEAGWSVGQDLAFLRTALPLPDAELLPPPRPFAETLAEIEDARSRISAASCTELAEVLGRVVKWNAGAPDDARRALLLETLARAGSLEAPGFLSAARAVAAAPGWINGGVKLNKPLKTAVENSPVILAANAIVEAVDRAGWDFRAALRDPIRENVNRALRNARVITYDGLIDHLLAALRGGQGEVLAARLRERYKVALVDESQDTDPRQFEIFRRIFLGGAAVPSRHRLVLIGDPKQAIYAFRGADVNTYLAARKLAEPRVFDLTETFRAPQPLVTAVNRLFEREHSLLKPGLRFLPARSGLGEDRELVVGEEPSPSRMEAWIVPDTGAKSYSNEAKRNALIAAAVASEIARLLNARAVIRTSGEPAKSTRVEPRHFAVLVSRHDEADAVAGALARRGVPAIRAGGADIMASDEATEVLILLRAMHEPRSSRLRRVALATRLIGCDHAEIRGHEVDGALDDAWLADLLECQAVWLRQGVASALAEADRRKGITRRLAGLAGGERRITNLRQLTDLLQAASANPGSHPGHLVHWLACEISRVEGRTVVEERQQQLESDAEAVQIVTMHSAKGLEFPLVFCPFLWTSTAPRKGLSRLPRPGLPPLLINTAEAEPAAVEALAREALEDRLRLAYVAITRAMVKVWIMGGECCGSKSGASALDWLLRESSPSDFAQWREAAASAGRGTRHAHGLEVLGSGMIEWKPPPSPSDVRWEPDAPVVQSLSTLPVPAIPPAWGQTSFSALTREKDPQAGEDDHHVVGAGPPVPANAFSAAPGGALVGTAVHDWIEQWDFATPDPARLKAHFSWYPTPDATPPLFESAARMFEELRGSVLPGLACPMAEACASAGASEWHFQLPINAALSSRRLAEVFSRHGLRDYAARLDALPGEELAGFLHGFLDRIAFHRGAWGVIDWKTNRLDAYGPDELRESAASSHYLLQTHLYLVALRRYLGPEATIAGAWLVYLRGIRTGTSDGILHVQPGQRLMADLDALFATPVALS